jgi:predicted ribosome quality control (RQC) complex YloA/Tae2 family protein
MQGHADALLSQPSPSRQQIEAAQKLYRQARKLRRSVGAITPRLELHRQRHAWMETSLTFLEQADSPDQLKALEEEMRQELPEVLPPGGRPGQGAMTNRAQRRQAAGGALPPQPLELRTAAGLQLQVGRNHRQNEWISLRQARRGDLWFHAQECPGSHVVLKGSEQPPGGADLRAAADLAAHFSRARGNTRVPVVMVPAEDLQRIPGAAAGTVRHRGGEILWGEPDRARLLLEPSYSLGGGPP